MAAASLANIVKSSLGPLGLDKMLVDDIGVRMKVFINEKKNSYSKFLQFLNKTNQRMLPLRMTVPPF